MAERIADSFTQAEVQQLIDRLNELEDIADEMKNALAEYHVYYTGEAYAHDAVIKYNTYVRNHYHPRPVADKQPGAAWQPRHS